MRMYYNLVCTSGEAKGTRLDILKDQWPIIREFLRAQTEWTIAVAECSITYEPDQPVFTRYMESQKVMLDRAIFKSKWQARSFWDLEESIL